MSTKRMFSNTPMAAILFVFTISVSGIGYPNGLLWEYAPGVDFSGEVTGGTLYFHSLLGHEEPSIRLETKKGQNIAEITDSLDAEIRKKYTRFLNGIMWIDTETDSRILDLYLKRDGLLRLPRDRGRYILGGTETGLGILPPVGSVSATCVNGDTEFTLAWTCKNDYEYLAIVSTNNSKFSISVNPLSENSLFPVKAAKTRLSAFAVVGLKNGVPTNASRIWANRTNQIDYFCLPFTNNITPNWTGWILSAKRTISLQEHIPERFEKTEYDSYTGTLSHRRAQLLRSDIKDAQGGMYRFFIAQEPGRTYRPALRCLVEEEAKAFKGEWSFDIMMGLISLDDAYELDNATKVVLGDKWDQLKKLGSDIREWHFDNTMDRSERWPMNQTGAEDSDIAQKDLIPTEAKPAIFMIVKLTGHKPNGVAIDGVRVVDVTDGFLNEAVRKFCL
jgi:hypothetical protein